MGGNAIPIVILAGSDRQPVVLPESGRDKHPLAGCKSVDVHIDGRPLIAVVVERIRAVGQFGPIYLVGPARAHDCVREHTRWIESDGTVGQNFRKGLESAREAHPGTPVAFTTCDILADVATVRRLMAEYRNEAPCDLWLPLVEAPAEEGLGASDWKPKYRIIPEPGGEPVRVLPGHLTVADPDALRLKFLYRLLDVGYRTRNRPIRYRRTVIVRGVAAALLYQDFLHLFAGRMPTLTWSVLSTGIAAARKLRAGRITREQLEEALRKILVNHRHLRRHPRRRVLLPIVDALSLALDIDTEEEARAAGGAFDPRSA